MTKETKQALTSVPVVVAGTILSVITGGLVFYFTAQASQIKDVSEVKSAVAVLQKSDMSQDQQIGDVKENVEYIRRVVEEQARRQGIIIKQ